LTEFHCDCQQYRFRFFSQWRIASARQDTVKSLSVLSSYFSAPSGFGEAVAPTQLGFQVAGYTSKRSMQAKMLLGLAAPIAC
jgi:hypothetical protein